MASRPALSRRSLLLSAPLALLTGLSLREVHATPASKLEQIRARVGGRVGIYVLDTHSGGSLGMDEDARYAMASTFKLMLAAWILQQVDAKRLSLPQTVRFEPGDVVTTGTRSNGAVNDIAILWPPTRQPTLAAVYMSESTAGTEALNAAHAQIGRLIAESLA